MKIALLGVSILAIILSSTILAATITSFQAEKYLDIINQLDDSHKHILDDLCGMMDIALKFRDDPDYNYDPSEMERIVMQDGVNGTQEMIDLYNQLMNVTESDVEAWKNLNTTSADLDGDGLSCQVEETMGSDPLDWDSDGDGLSDGLEYVLNAGVSTSAAPVPQILTVGALLGFILAKKKLNGKKPILKTCTFTSQH